MLYGTQRGGQMRHFRKDLKTATRLGAVLNPFKSIIYTSIRARARRFIFFYFWLLSKATDFFDELWILVVASGGEVVVGVHVFEDRWRGLGGRLGDNVDVARALACARAHSTSIIFYYFNYFEG